jgi:hypothetical protein
MLRSLSFLALALLLLFPAAQANPQNDAPPISITSPDKGTTYAFGTIKNHTLIWSKNQKMLIARITFTADSDTQGTLSDDTQEFRLPGVAFDEAKGIFTATTAKGEVIPVAHYKNVLFIKSVETLPNAAVRVLHPRGVITVILEAIRPDDPALHAPPDDSDPNENHSVDISHLMD